ncbi:MAG: hypothetical protein KDD28_29155, partial [Phaeodactylibacter sp.]|nr:hypothetical protein [Phaeodactylibacter sp.]
QFIYEVTYNGPLISGPNQGGSGGGGGGGAVTTGFTGAFAPANWTITEPPPSGVGGASGLGDVTFSATNLLITSGVDAGAVVSITLPANGILSFDFDYQQEADIQDDIIIIDLENNLILELLEDTPGGVGSVDQIVTGSGSADEPVQAGWVLMFIIRGEGFQTGGFDSFLDIFNFRFEAAGGGGGGGVGSFPFFNFEDCWGYI